MDINTTFVPPNSKELEEAVIGAVLITADAYDQVGFLDPGHFYQPSNVIVWDAIRATVADGKPVDILTVLDTIKGMGKLEYIGGPGYLVDLTNKVASAAHLEAHARVVWEKAVGRTVLHESQKAISEIIGGGDIPDVISHLETTLINLRKHGVNRTQSSDKVVEDMIKSAQKLADLGNDIPGRRFFGIEEVEHVFYGIEPADVIMIGGRPKSGKSSVSNNIIGYHVRNNIPLFNCSGEMQNRKAGWRVIAEMTGIPTLKLRQGVFFKDTQIIDKVSDALEKLKAAPVYFDEGPLSIPKLRSDVKLYHGQHGVDLFLIDRVELFAEITSGRDRYGALTDITAAMRVLANELGVSFVAYTQLNSEVEKTTDKRGQAVHMFGATGSQANCTKAAIIFRPDMYQKDEFPAPHKGVKCRGKAEIYTVLSNDYPLESTIVNFDGPCQCFRPNSSDDYFDFPETDNLITIERGKLSLDDDLPF